MNEELSKIVLQEFAHGQGWAWWVADKTGREVGRCRSISYSKLEHAKRNAEIVLGIEIVLLKIGGRYTGGVAVGRAIDVEVARG